MKLTNIKYVVQYIKNKKSAAKKVLQFCQSDKIAALKLSA